MSRQMPNAQQDKQTVGKEIVKRLKRFTETLDSTKAKPVIELKWKLIDSTPSLWFRTALAVDASGAYCPNEWSEWKKVEWELSDDQPQKKPNEITWVQFGRASGPK